MLSVNHSSNPDSFQGSAEDTLDLAIIGAGPAGLTAGMYGARSRYRTFIFEKMAAGGTITITEWIENYPGFPEGISGYELASKMEEQALHFGARLVQEEVVKIERDGPYKIIYTDQRQYRARALLLVTGTSLKKLGVSGEKEYTGRGVSYCATCDGAFYKDKVVVVVGGGDSAVEEGIYLTKFARKVILIHRRDQLRAAKIVQERAFTNPRMEFIWDSVVEEIKGESKVTHVVLRNLKTEVRSVQNTDGVFVFVGQIPNNQLAQSLGLQRDDRGFVITGSDMQTSEPGIWAAGDIRSKSLLQIATAVGEGAQAEFSAEKYLEAWQEGA
ncbi:MAG: thioredoxin-disulfide reductase [Candidatus Delongbacteria bacterium]|nr:thioredoxin-disulfide reductase [Candidatus Delongbacteria bacterium]